MEGESIKKELPFNNLFLNTGFVTGLNHWYLYLLTFFFTLLCYFLAPAFTSLHLIMMALNKGMSLDDLKNDVGIIYDYERIDINRNYILIALFGIFLITFWGFRWALRKIQLKPLISVFTAYDKVRWPRFLFAFLLWSVMVLITGIASYISNPGNYTLAFEWQGFFISLLLMVIFLPVQSAFEEIFFRGFMMQGLALAFRNGLMPLIITSVLFGSAHLSNPEVELYGKTTMLIYYVTFGFFLGAIALLDEGLELSFGIHLANNLISSVLVCSKHSVLKTYSVLEEVNNSPPAVEIIISFLAMGIAFILFRKKYKWNNLSLIIK